MKKTMLTLSFIVSAYILKAQVLYGTTSNEYDDKRGTICKLITATNTLTAAFSFDAIDGSNPEYSKLLQASDGKLYGMTSSGGSGGVFGDYGVIFSYNPAISTFTKLEDFDEPNGYLPYGDLVQASDGKLYGTTTYGGNNDDGIIFSYDPLTSAYIKLKDFDVTNGGNPIGTLIQASDGKLYGMTCYGGINGLGVIFSFDPATSAYKKLGDFGTNNTGNYITAALTKDKAKKLYGMAKEGGKYGAGTIFSYDANTSVFIKLIDFDGTNGAFPHGSLAQASDGKLYGMTGSGGSGSGGYGVFFSYDLATSTYTNLKDFDYTNGAYPNGSLIQASDGKLYGMTSYGGSNGAGVIFSFDPATSIYTKLKNFDYTNGREPYGSLMQASDGKLYGMTAYGGKNDHGVIFSFDPITSTYTKLKDFNYTNGAYPHGSLIQASEGKLYGMTSYGGKNDYGVIFSYDPATSIYAKLMDFDDANGSYPDGSLVQASDAKLYGMTSHGGSNDYGVAFSYDPATSTYTKLSDFNGDNGSYPAYTSFTEMSAGDVQISIADKSVIEGNQDRKFIAIPVNLSEKSSKKIIRVKYNTQNNTAKAGSDYTAQSGTLVFLPGLKKTILPMRIKGDQTPEANETFRIILSDPVNATIADSTGVITILDDDASTSNAEQKNIKTICSISLSPNPAQDKMKIMLTGYSGNVIIQLSSFDGRILQQQRLQAFSAKSAPQQINVGSYANGTYLVTAIDEKGNRQTERLVIGR